MSGTMKDGDSGENDSSADYMEMGEMGEGDTAITNVGNAGGARGGAATRVNVSASVSGEEIELHTINTNTNNNNSSSAAPQASSSSPSRTDMMQNSSKPSFGRSIINRQSSKIGPIKIDVDKAEMGMAGKRGIGSPGGANGMNPFQDPENTNEEDLDAYYDLLAITLENTGRWAFGVNAIEVWLYNPDINRLVAADGSWWRDMVNQYDVDARFQETISRLEDESSPDFINPVPLVPGKFMSKYHFKIHTYFNTRMRTLYACNSRISILLLSYSKRNPITHIFTFSKKYFVTQTGTGAAGILWQEEHGNSTIKSPVWRDLRQLANDPDEQPNERLKALADAFGLAKGFYFHNQISNTQGIVIFYARYTCDTKKLSTISNTNYLRASADLLGSLVSWKVPRLYAINSRRGDLNDILRRVKLMLISLSRTGWIKNVTPQSQDDGKDDSIKHSFASFRQNPMVLIKNIGSLFFQRVSKTVSKFKGGQNKIPPPPVNLSGTIYALFGSFVSLLLASNLNEIIKKETESKIAMGPLGALVTCIYGLTNAPASQPRNGLLAVSIAGIIAVGSTYIPVETIPIWIRIALVPAITISATLGMGLPHPPAGTLYIIVVMTH